MLRLASVRARLASASRLLDRKLPRWAWDVVGSRWGHKKRRAGVWKGVWKSARKGEHVCSKMRAGVRKQASAGRPEEVSRSSKGERG